MTVGRGHGMDIKLVSQAVSRHHAVVSHHEGAFVITDVQSLHGVLLNGVRVHSAELREGDVLQLADVVLIYEEG